MKKKVYGRKFSRDHGSRKAMFRSLIKALIVNGKINTTLIKAKSIQRAIDKLAIKAKRADLNSVKAVVSALGNDKKSTGILVEKARSFFQSRVSGFTTIVKLPRRRGDNAQMARIEWVDKHEEVKTIDISEKSNSKKEKKQKTKSSLKEKLSTLTKNPRKSVKKSA